MLWVGVVGAEKGFSGGAAGRGGRAKPMGCVLERWGEERQVSPSAVGRVDGKEAWRPLGGRKEDGVEMESHGALRSWKVQETGTGRRAQAG